MLTVTSGLAYAGKGIFGSRDAPEPEPEPVAAEAVVEAPPPPPPPPPAPRLFTGGLPVAVQSVPEGLANLTAQGCNGCHYAAHDAWSGTAHAQAWADPAFQEAIERVGGSTSCTGCHLPLANQHGRLAAGYLQGDLTRPDLQPNESWDPVLMSEGVTCTACHVREGKVLGTRSVAEAPHPVVASDELGSSKMCATCHQLTWPEADRPFYDTYGEWESSPYSTAGVRCQDCHMPLEAGPATATRFAAQPHHGFEADLARALSILIDLDRPEVQRGEPVAVSVRLQNTGAGHSVPTGSPFKIYRVTVDLVDADDQPLVEPFSHDLGRVISDAPPWATLTDNRIAAGTEVELTTTFEVSQKAKSPTATLRVRVQRVVGDDTSEPMLERRIPLRLL